MQFKIVESKKSPEELVERLNKLAEGKDVRVATSMFWQPRGAIVIVGYEEPVKVEDTDVKFEHTESEEETDS